MLYLVIGGYALISANDFSLYKHVLRQHVFLYVVIFKYKLFLWRESVVVVKQIGRSALLADSNGGYQRG